MNKGFTLVETIAAVLILSVIALIAIPRIQNALHGTQDEAYEMVVKNVEDQAYEYFIDNNLDALVTANKSIDVYIKDMVTGGYVTNDDLHDPRTKADYIDPENSYVRFSLVDGSLECSSNIIIYTP